MIKVFTILLLGLSMLLATYFMIQWIVSFISGRNDERRNLKFKYFDEHFSARD